MANDTRAAASARYDEIADWYREWVGDGPGMLFQHSLLPDLAGTRVLDLACGHGRSARELARRGAVVVGVDISQRLIEEAIARERRDHLRIEYIAADVVDLRSWWDGVTFDGCVCELALMDIEDLDGALTAAATVVRPGGWFIASIVHPCFPGGETGLPSWPPEGGYDAEGWWISPDHNPSGARIRVGAYHRKLSTYMNATIDAGFGIEHVVEPAALIPTFLVFVCRRNG